MNLSRIAMIFLVYYCTLREYGNKSTENTSFNEVPANESTPKKVGQKLNSSWYGTWEQAGNFSKSTLTIS
jgi:hypothetical protein